MDIIQTLQDKNLLGQFIDDPKTWTAWLTFLRAFFGLPRTKGDLKLYRDCTGRSKWPSKPAREAWLAVGTRAGKSYVSSLIATFLATLKKYRLSPGERGYVLIVAPTKRQANIIKRYLSSFFNENLFLRPFVVRETGEEIELNNGIIILVLSSDYRTLRGYTAIAAIVDEVAYLNIEGSKPDVEVVRALRSRLMSTRGPLICVSSPYAKRGELYRVYKRHWAKSNSQILVWQAPSLAMNPTLDADAIQAARAEDPEAAKADYDAMFRADIETFIARAILEGLVVPDRHVIPWMPETRYSAFVDPSGGSRDSMALCISHQEKRMKVVDLIMEFKAPFDPEDVTEQLAKLLKSYKINIVKGDRYAGEWPRKAFARYGIKYDLAPLTKSDYYRELLPLLMSGQVELLDNPRLISQLANLERRTGRGGRDSIDHPPGARDDLANCVAGSLVELATRKRRAGVWGSEYANRSEGRPPLSQIANPGLVIAARERERARKRKRKDPYLDALLSGKVRIISKR